MRSAAGATSATETDAAASSAAASRFISLAEVPAFGKGFLLPGGSCLVERKQRSFEDNKLRSAFSVSRLDSPTLGGFELRGASLVQPSPSGRRLLVVRNPTESEKQVVLELWGGGRLLREVEVPATLHGAVYTDGWLECATWSPDEKSIVYAAEAPQPSRTPLWGGRAPPGLSGAEDGWRGEGEFREDWGEAMTGKRQSALFIVSAPSGEVRALRGLPPDCSCGQATWTPDGAAIVFAAFEHTGSNFGAARRLGLVYCFNRPSKLYSITAASGSTEPEPVATLLSAGRQSAASPRFSPTGETLLFLSNDSAVSTGAHNNAFDICLLAWSNGAAGQLTVPQFTGDGETFPGFFLSAPLTRCPWISESRLLLATTWHSGDALVQIDFATGIVRRVSPALASGGHWTLLDVAAPLALAACSTPATPPALMVASVADDWAWRPVDAATEPWRAESVLGSLEWRLVDVPLSGASAGDPPVVQAFLLRPIGDAPLPGILVPHGGPHSASVAAFSAPLAFLAAQGYAVLQVNYRGSTGFGRANLESFLGHAGVQDVADCISALDAAVAAQLIDPERVAVFGGSHGGFLAAHLIGQHPSRFRAACCRNPVTDLASMVGLTDIPDWCFVETGGLGKAQYAEPPSLAALQAMRLVSPVAHVDAGARSGSACAAR